MSSSSAQHETTKSRDSKPSSLVFCLTRKPSGKPLSWLSRPNSTEVKAYKNPEVVSAFHYANYGDTENDKFTEYQQFVHGLMVPSGKFKDKSTMNKHVNETLVTVNNDEKYPEFISQNASLATVNALNEFNEDVGRSKSCREAGCLVLGLDNLGTKDETVNSMATYVHRHPDPKTEEDHQRQPNSFAHNYHKKRIKSENSVKSETSVNPNLRILSPGGVRLKYPDCMVHTMDINSMKELVELGILEPYTFDSTKSQEEMVKSKANTKSVDTNSPGGSQASRDQEQANNTEDQDPDMISVAV